MRSEYSLTCRKEKTTRRSCHHLTTIASIFSNPGLSISKNTCCNTNNTLPFYQPTTSRHDPGSLISWTCSLPSPCLLIAPLVHMVSTTTKSVQSTTNKSISHEKSDESMCYSTAACDNLQGNSHSYWRDILASGLLYAGFDTRRQAKSNLDRNMKRYKQFYGIDPSNAAPLFRDLRNEFPSFGWIDDTELALSER